MFYRKVRRTSERGKRFKMSFIIEMKYNSERKNVFEMSFMRRIKDN